jgi:Fe-S cluster assembly protein SufD
MTAASASTNPASVQAGSGQQSDLASASEPSTAQTGAHDVKKHSDGRRVIPVQTRSERFTSFEVTDFPEVTGREVMWKFTPVAQLRTLINDTLDGSRYEIDTTDTPGVDVAWGDRNDARVGGAGKPEDKASANAWSQFDKALTITVSGDSDKEFTLRRAKLGCEARAAHTIITAEPFSRATVILRNTGHAHITENIEIVVGEGASLTVVSVQEWNNHATHLASHFAKVQRNASLKHVVVSLSGEIVRVNPSTVLAEEGAEVNAYGLYFSHAGQHLEQQVFVNHDAPHTRSRVNYKGALNGEGARSVWIGDVLIGRKAAGTDSYEQNRNLVLSDGTRADSIPNLEIETGDILGAGHASATGRFDDEQLFYLQARGISEAEARRLVVRGFLFEIVQHIGSPTLENELQHALEAELTEPTTHTAPTQPERRPAQLNTGDLQ